MFGSVDWITLLVFLNQLVTAATAVLGFSLAVYILVNNFRSGVALGFVALLGCLLVVYVGDLVVPYVTTPVSAQRWLRFQWLGIGFMPAAYLHLSDAVLRSAGHISVRQRAAVVGSYALSTFLVALALFSDLVVRSGTYAPPINQMAPGLLFPAFVIYDLFNVAYGAYNVYQARQQTLTVEARRRLTYLAFAFTAPGLAVFPYLILAPYRSRSLVWIVMAVTLGGNVVVALALVVMAYTVAYYGVLAPERMVKRNLVRFLLRGPVLAVAVVLTALVLLQLNSVLGIPREVLLIFSVAGLMVMGQGVLQFLMPWIDRLVYSRDRQELAWLEELDRRLLTSSDLHQFLNNTLVTLCELMRATHGFVVVIAEDAWRLQAAYGPVGDAMRILTAQHLAEILRLARDVPLDAPWPFIPHGAYLVAPLRAGGEETIIGLLGLAPQMPLNLSDEERERVRLFLARARAAVEDRYLQQQIFSLVRDTIPTIARLQQMHGVPREAGMMPRTDSQEVASEADFVRWVRDALRHFWGGPKLSDSPLLNLRVVAEEAEARGTHRTRALQNVLLEAIERLRPEGQRKMTTSEWLLYNILEMKFVQGKRVQEVAQRLAMSESDLYRKQRVAIAEVARVLREMEATRVAEAQNGRLNGQQTANASAKILDKRPSPSV